MYCQVCGFDNTQGTNFCKRCGTPLSPNAPSTRTRESNPIVTIVFIVAICFITLAGFSLPMVAFSELHDKVIQGALIAFAALILGATILIDALLIHLFTKYLGLAKSQFRTPPQIPRPKYNTSEQEYHQLTEPPYAIPSVTEHTTRNFEPLPEKRAKETS